MKTVYENKILDATLTATTENINFPLTNLQENQIYKTYRSTAKNAQRIVIDLASLKSDYVYLKNYNFTSSVTLRLEANTSDSWGSPAFSETLTYNSEYIILNFTESTYNYWSLYIDDTTNTNDYIELGLFVLGVGVELPGMSPDQIFTDKSDSTASYSRSNQMYGNEEIMYRENKITFPALTFTQRDTLRNIFRAVKNIRPILLIVWEDDLTYESPIYCNINKDSIEWGKSDKKTSPFKASFDFRENF